MHELSRHRAPRLFAGTLAIIALAGQLASFAHLVRVRHVTCAEHGELIEIGREQSTVATNEPRQTSPAVHASSAVDAHGHDHCLLAPARRPRATLSTSSSFDCAHLDAYGTIGLVVDCQTPAPIAVILFAPKNSPPLA